MFAAPTAEETTTSRTLTPAQDTLVSAVEQKLAAWSAVRGKDWKRDVDASRHLTRALNKMVGGFLGEGFEARVVLYPVQQKDVADEAKAKHQDAEDKASAKGAQRP
jgi:hypothetical protein